MDEKEKMISIIETLKTYLNNTTLGDLDLASAEVEIVTFELNKVLNKLKKL